MAVGSEMAAGRAFPRLHWGAVIAGVLLAIAVHIVMGLIGGALGIAAAPADSRALGVGAAIWALITPFVATVCGAWLACRMAGTSESTGAYLHGVLVWCVGLIAGALFLAGTVATGAMSAGTAASGNLGPAQRMVGGRTTGPNAGAGAEEAAKGAAAATGGAALAAIAGLLGGIVGAGLSQRRSSGRGMGWRIAIERREHAGDGRFATHGARAEDRAYAPTSYPERPATGLGGQSGSAEPPTSDPYHH